MTESRERRWVINSGVVAGVVILVFLVTLPVPYNLLGVAALLMVLILTALGIGPEG